MGEYMGIQLKLLIMKALPLMLLAFSACGDCFHVHPDLTPYQHHAAFICPTFPFCYQHLVTGAWKSQFKTEETKGSVTLSVQRDIESPECLKNGHYCRSDASNLIRSIKLETAEECNDKCIAEKSCLVFNFHLIRGQGYCSLLTECLYESKCGEDEKCATGQKNCGCPPLEYSPGQKESKEYSRWSCQGLDPYSESIPVGTTCSSTCPVWKDFNLKSTCLRSGKWSATVPSGEPLQASVYSASYPTPDQPDLECGCQEVGKFVYDPNEEDRAEFTCKGRNADEFKNPRGWTIKNGDKCELLCSNEPKPFVSAYCEKSAWKGQPDLGFWCYDKPDNPGPQEVTGDPQCAREHAVLADEWRKINLGVKHNKMQCDKELTPGWYRFKFTDRPYAKIPTYPPKPEHRDGHSCGTRTPSWMPGSLPTIGEPAKEITINFAWRTNEKEGSAPGKVVACGEGGNTVYLYYLTAAPFCYLGYCAL